MDQLGREVNACVAGIRERHPDATITVWDGHGSGGLREADVDGATYVREGQPYYHIEDCEAMAFVGEFGCRAWVAGLQGVPTILLTGDDKACREAEIFRPEIETVATKRGTGEESAEHVGQGTACELIREGTIRGLDRRAEIPPVAGFSPP